LDNSIIEHDFREACRELSEETGITRKDISIKRLMDFRYYTSDAELQVYAGRLNKEVKLTVEKHPLEWLWLKYENFFNLDKFAGEGNIGHMLEQVKLHPLEVSK